MKIVLLCFSLFALSIPALADTRSGSSEEQAEAHSQPDKPHPQKSGGKAKAGKKESSSAGSSRPTLDADGELAFKKHDLDGDGDISKAEAAGSDLISAFDRFDRNKDGKLDRAEYARMLAAPKRQAAR